ncbi:hypothetical protein BH09BAC5_BH09BAC5_08820 [soil metagenome]
MFFRRRARVAYRYGFNGKENDPESVSTGEGLQDYGMRIYNPAIGKFLSVDPLMKSYPMLTPYQFASNMPIVAVDLDGLEASSTTGSSDTRYKGTYAEMPSNLSEFDEGDYYDITRTNEDGSRSTSRYQILLANDGSKLSIPTGMSATLKECTIVDNKTISMETFRRYTNNASIQNVNSTPQNGINYKASCHPSGVPNSNLGKNNELAVNRYTLNAGSGYAIGLGATIQNWQVGDGRNNPLYANSSFTSFSLGVQGGQFGASASVGWGGGTINLSDPWQRPSDIVANANSYAISGQYLLVGGTLDWGQFGSAGYSIIEFDFGPGASFKVGEGPKVLNWIDLVEKNKLNLSAGGTFILSGETARTHEDSLKTALSNPNDSTSIKFLKGIKH